MIITDNFTFDLIAIIATILAVVIAYIKHKLTYWDRPGLPTLNPTIPFGDTKDLLLGRQSLSEQFRRIYDELKAAKAKHGGIYFGFKPVYMPIDPQIIKKIMQKDFAHFLNHGSFFADEDHDPLSAHLFSLEDTKWKSMRTKLTPTFTSGKMKMMFQTFVDCAEGLKDIMNETATKRTAVDIKEVLGCFTTDIIGSVAFGIECNSLKNPDAEFRKYGRKIFEIDSFKERMRVLLQLVVPHNLLRMMKFKATKGDVERFFMNAVRETVEYREKNKVYRKDFMQLLLQLKNKSEETITKEEPLTMNELAAQAYVFFIAGFETSSTTMTFALYELATNPDVQDKLRQEIKTVFEKHEGNLTYDGVTEMTYLDKVINETLRKHPPVGMLFRKCTKDYTIPDTTVHLKTGDQVYISVMGLHHDPEYYPNPEKFDPERFSEKNKNTRPDFTWIPFGEGPRVCIGLRFGVLQSKVGLITLLKNYRITLNRKTKLPLALDKASFITTVEGGIWLNVEKID